MAIVRRQSGQRALCSRSSSCAAKWLFLLRVGSVLLTSPSSTASGARLVSDEEQGLMTIDMKPGGSFPRQNTQTIVLDGKGRPIQAVFVSPPTRSDPNYHSADYYHLADFQDRLTSRQPIENDPERPKAIMGNLANNVCEVGPPSNLIEYNHVALPNNSWVSSTVDRGKELILRSAGEAGFFRRIIGRVQGCTPKKLVRSMIEAYILWLFSVDVAIESFERVSKSLKFLFEGAIQHALAGKRRRWLLDMRWRLAQRVKRPHCRERPKGMEADLYKFAHSTAMSDARKNIACAKLQRFAEYFGLNQMVSTNKADESLHESSFGHTFTVDILSRAFPGRFP